MLGLESVVLVISRSRLNWFLCVECNDADDGVKHRTVVQVSRKLAVGACKQGWMVCRMS